MFQAQAITQASSDQIRQQLIASVPPGSDAHNLLSGIGSTLFNTLLQAALSQLMTWIQDPANLQMIITQLLGLFNKKTTP